MFGFMACPVLAVCLVKLLSRVIPKSPYDMILAVLVLGPLMAFPTGITAYHWHKRNLAIASKKSAEYASAQRATSDALQALLMSDPEIALRERWFEWRRNNEAEHYLFSKSLENPQIPYNLSQLARIYKEAPEARALVVVHPACDAEFLTTHWKDALNKAEAGDDKILTAIVSNPRTPIALLENLESSSLTLLKTSSPLKNQLDFRLHKDELVINKGERIQAITSIGPIKLYEQGLSRSCEWKNATRSAILESLVEGSTVHFYGFEENSGQANVTTRIEFREGRKNFRTMEQADQWIRQQSGKIPTVYRNDGLTVSCSVNSEKNQLTVEIWQILINKAKPQSLPGSDDSKIMVTAQVTPH